MKSTVFIYSDNKLHKDTTPCEMASLPLSIEGLFEGVCWGTWEPKGDHVVAVFCGDSPEIAGAAAVKAGYQGIPLPGALGEVSEEKE